MDRRGATLGELLRQYRLMAGLSQEELAERARLSPNAIGSLERGINRKPYPRTIALLAAALGLTAEQHAALVVAARSELGDRPSQPVWPEPRRPDSAGVGMPSNLPVATTSFVGRAREIVELKERLQATRLLTLTGTGGCGKTRLALQVAADVLAAYPDGVWFVDLAPLADPTLVPLAVAAALGVHESAGRPLLLTVADALRGRDLLLVLDNCEHLVAPCAHLVDTLLHTCPRLRILATSREVLGASGEIVWRVPSLSAPDPRHLPPTDVDPAALVDRSDAARLFAERARQVVPDFRITADNARTVAHICHRLDGIPLAIELAAARVRVLGIEQIAGRLDDRFRLLTGGSRTVLRRQQTLRAALDWSYDLLSPREQTLFRQLAVFAGGFALEAAEAVCGEEMVGPREARLESGGVPSFFAIADRTSDTPSVLDLLAALADKSLVLVDTGTGREPRYRLLETLREYALERRAAAEEAEAIHQAHAMYYRKLGEQAGDEIVYLQRDFFDSAFLVETDNLRAALRWFRDRRDWDGCLSLTGSLGPYWLWSGQLNESERWLDLARRHADQATPATRSRALANLGWMEWGRGRFAAAEDLAREGRRLCRERGDRRGVANALILLGTTLRDFGKLDEAEPVIVEALRLFPEVGLSATFPLFQLGLVFRQRGELGEARRHLTEAARVAQERGLAVPLSSIVHNLGLVAEDEGALDEARAFYAKSVPVGRLAHTRWFGPYSLEGFATLAARQGQAERCVVLAGAAAVAREQMGTRIPQFLQERLDRALGPARAQLGAAAEAAWVRGRAMTLEQAFDYALEEDGG